MWPMHQQSLMLLHPMVKEKMHLQENTLFDPWPWGQGNTKCCPVPSTSCDLWNSKVWYCYISRLRRRCIYKKKQNVAKCRLHHVTYAPTEFEVTTSRALERETFTRKFNIWPLTLTLGSRSHEMLPSTFYIMWPIQLKSSKLLGQKVKEEMHLQENSIFKLWPWGQGHTKCCPVSSTSCDLFSYKIWSCYVKKVKEEMHLQENSIFDLWPWIIVTYSATKFEVATSNRLGGDTFTRKYIIWPWQWRSHEILLSTLYIMWPINQHSLKLLPLTVKEIHLQENTLFDLWPWPWGQGHTKCCPVSSTSCDLFSHKVWSC